MTTTNDIVIPSTSELTPADTQLAELSAKANAAHGRVFKAAGDGLLAALEAGQALLQARKMCLGHFLAWLPANFKASVRTAERYMEFAEECHAIGGMDSSRVSSLPPQELGRVWSQLLGRRGGKQARRLPAPPNEAAGDAAARGAAQPMAESPPPAPAIERETPPRCEPDSAPVDLMATLEPLFEALIDRCHQIGFSKICEDGAYAERLAAKLEPHYYKLVDYLESRQECREEAG